MKRVALCWSSGKDSAWALHVLKQSPGVEVVALITTFNRAAGRVAMHDVHRHLVEAQAEQVQLPLWSVELPWPCSNAAYESLTSEIWRQAITQGIAAIAFGDLFLRTFANTASINCVAPGWSLFFQSGTYRPHIWFRT